MSWVAAIDTIDDDTRDGDLDEMRNRVADPKTGRVDHIMAIHSLNQQPHTAHGALYRSALSGTAKLRKVDRDVLDIVEATARSAYVNRIANGFGVTLEPWLSDD